MLGYRGLVADDAGLERAHALSSKLFRAVHRAQADFETMAQEVGLTGLQARTLLWLETPKAMGTLAEHLSCDASNVTGLADRLERLGMLERLPGSDRRMKLLSLTDHGRVTRDQLAQRVAVGSTVIARLSPAQQQHLGELLDELLE